MLKTIILILLSGFLRKSVDSWRWDTAIKKFTASFIYQSVPNFAIFLWCTVIMHLVNISCLFLSSKKITYCKHIKAVGYTELVSDHPVEGLSVYEYF